jgi:hypothetical protein
MSEHLSTQDLKDLLHNRKSLERTAAAAEHLRHCPSCLDKLHGSQSARARLADLEHLFAPAIATGHLSYDELEGFVDHTLPLIQNERVEAHIAICSNCRTQVDGLRQLAPQETFVVNATTTGDVGFRDKVRAIFFPRLPVWGVASICLLVIAGASAWLTYRNRAPERAAGVTVEPANNESGKTQPGEPELQAKEDISRLSNSGPAMPEGSEDLRASIRDGSRTVGVDGEGNIVGYEGLSTKYQELVKQVLSNGRIGIRPRPDDLATAADPVMGGGERDGLFKINGPSGKMLLTDRPTLSWQPLSGTESYRVDVFDSNLKKVASSGALRSTAWSTRLSRGMTYTWQVTANRDGHEFKAPQTPQSAARFHIVSNEHYSEISSFQKKYRDSHLLLAIAYADAGLRDEAVRELKIVARQNPRSQLPQHLIGQLQKKK